jgi:hypothetical protein
MQVLFLDFDGVLNSRQHFLATAGFKVPGADTLSDANLFKMKNDINRNNIWVLGYILDQVPDLKIVISSAWRMFYDMEDFNELFKIFKLDPTRIIGKTPKKFSSERHTEIKMWLDDWTEINHKQVDFLAVDDHVIWDLMQEFKDREILTDPWVGLSMHDAFKIIKHFYPEYKEPEIML